jgi:aldose 1-epimerase
MTCEGPTAPSGKQYELGFGDQRAVVAEVGGTLREYTVGGRDVIVPFDVGEAAPLFNGAVLLPWPNRLRDGRFSVGGERWQVPITEPGRRNTALHGLALWQRWSLVDATEASVRLALDLPAQAGWWFQIRSEVTYSLGEGGLTVELTTWNIGPEGSPDAPYGAGFHPWFAVDPATWGEHTLRLPARTRVVPDRRLLPKKLERARGRYNLSKATPLAKLDLDDAWTDPVRDSSGLAWAELRTPDGHTTSIWMDESLASWQVCTADHIPGMKHYGVAIEPQTCAADAFNTGRLLVRLSPGHSHTVRWGVRFA